MPRNRVASSRPISPEAFARLLRRLGDDPDSAAREYESLRLALVKFFDWRGAWPPDDCADETLDRLAQKLDTEIHIEDVRRYAHGVARMVLLERLRSQARAAIDSRADLSLLSAPAESSSDPLLHCFDRCLSVVPPASRSLMLEYYVGRGQSKIEHRRSLARSLAISDNALRSRLHRLRDQLEACTRSCVERANASGLDDALRHVAVVPDTLKGKVSDGR
jgi:DNA-directed RNA polymerase specialized sigma24 family protein